MLIWDANDETLYVRFFVPTNVKKVSFVTLHTNVMDVKKIV